jgi:hypothetical protein
MNPLWFIAKAAGITIIAVAGINHLMKTLAPRPSNLIGGAVHFRKAVDEFGKGLDTVFFGPEHLETKKTKEASKIPID